MRIASRRFASLAVALLAVPACNAIFGIEGGMPASSATNGGSSSSTTSTSHSSTTSTSSSSTTSTSTSSSSSSGGSTCTGSCNGTMLTACDANGHPKPPQDCGADAVCDPVGQTCGKFNRLSVGANRACAIDDKHGVHCWGFNHGSPIATGSLLIGDPHGMFTQPQTIQGLSAWQVAVADTFQCALQQNGDVLCWGSGPDGELGTIPPSNSYIPLAPVKVNGLPKPAVEVGTASGCSCARLTDGTVWCWGLVDSGCHGDGAASNNQTAGPTPTEINLGNPATEIRIGDGQYTPSCARLGGLVYCWGRGYKPTIVPTVSDANDIAVGPEVVFIQRSNGVYWSAPVPPVPPATAWTFAPPMPFSAATGTVTAMAAGITFCTAGTGTTVTCTPLYDDQLPMTGFKPPTTVTAPGPVVELASGYGAAGIYSATVQCMRISGKSFDQSVYCWGDDANGDLGVGGPEYFTKAQPVNSPKLPGAASSLTCAESSTAVVLAADSSAHYWGDGEAYEGNGVRHNTPTAQLTPFGNNNARIRTNDGQQYSYALKTAAATPALLFNGTPETGQRLLSYTSTSFTDVFPGFVDLGLLSTHQIVAYADKFVPGNVNPNDCGIFGDGTQTASTTAPHLDTVPPGAPLSATLLSAYVDPSACPAHACAVDLTGALWCWGSNGVGESGYDVTPPADYVLSPRKVTILGVTKPIVSVAKGYNFTCATDGNAAGASGQVYCWGRNDYGQLGNSQTPDYMTALPVTVAGINNNGGTSPAVGVAAGYAHVCAWLADGSAMCWGDNDYGQLGTGDYDDLAAPKKVVGLTANVMSMSAGNAHTCALYTGGSVACWGSSYVGQVGTGKSGDYPAPTMVQNLPP